MSSGRKRSLSGPATSAPSAKKKRYFCSYQKSWESDFKWLKPSERGQHDAYCVLCKSHIYIGSAAKNDLTRHSKTQNHQKLELAQSQSKPMTNFLPNSKSALQEKITYAETLF